MSVGRHFPRAVADHLYTQALAFIIGFFLQDIKLALYIGLAGTALTFLVVVPPWPFFNRHPVAWLEPGGATQGTTVEKTG